MYDKALSLDQPRSAVTGVAADYHMKSTQNAEFEIQDGIQTVIDHMPVITHSVVTRLPVKILNRSRQACSSSIWGKLQAQDHMVMTKSLAFAKTQKKDSYYR